MTGKQDQTEGREGLAVTITFTNHNPATIWNRLAVELGRDPTHREACERVRRILSDSREVKP